MYACGILFAFYLILIFFLMGACANKIWISDDREEEEEVVVVAEGKRLINIIIVCFGYPQTNVFKIMRKASATRNDHIDFI